MFASRPLSSVAVFAFLLVSPLSTLAETIAMIGTGEVSRALGPRLARLGHEVIYGSRSPDRPEVRALVAETGGGAFATTQREASVNADIVVIAVPWDVAEEVVLNLGDLAGKIIVDPINPRIVGEDGYRNFPTYTSNAERIQNLAPQAYVVKAFNTMSRDTMVDPDLLGHPITVPLAGNDPAAKETVAEIVEALGFETIDLGPVRYAHIIEGLYLLRSNSRDVLDIHFDYHFRRRPEALIQRVE